MTWDAYKPEGINMIQTGSIGVRGAASRPVNKAVAVNGLEEQPITVGSGEEVI